MSVSAWTIPGPWHALVLVLAAFRLVRLTSWDDFPPVLRLRRWIIGEHWVPTELEDAASELGLPGKQPSSEVQLVRPAYRRPLLAHFVHCYWCIGFWISLTVYLAWLAAPRATLYALAPFALSSAVGLIARNLDA